MTRRLIVRVSLSLSLAGVPGGVLAQQTAAPVITGNVIGDCGAGVHAGDATITCGDLNRAPGMTVITPAGVERGPVPMDVVPASEPAPEVEPSPGDEAAPVDESVAETSVETNESDTAIEPDTAVASETDLDADNYPDALELDVGLDPNTVDTDGDGVADGDEGNLYGTDPTVADTDGDGVSDGGESSTSGRTLSFGMTLRPRVPTRLSRRVRRRAVPRWTRKTSRPVPRASTATMTASRMPTKPPLGPTPPPRTPMVMATTTVTRSTWEPIPSMPRASLLGSDGCVGTAFRPCRRLQAAHLSLRDLVGGEPEAEAPEPRECRLRDGSCLLSHCPCVGPPGP